MNSEAKVGSRQKIYTTPHEKIQIRSKTGEYMGIFRNSNKYKNSWKRKIKGSNAGFAAVILAAITVLAGCRVGDTNFYISQGDDSMNAFMIGTEKCPRNEAITYVSGFAEYFADIHEDDWIKNSALFLLGRVYSLNLYAIDNGIELDNDEKEACDSAAGIFYSGLDQEDRGKLAVSEADVRDMYERYALGLKVYRYITRQADEKVSEDEARVMDAYVLHVTDDEKVEEINTRLAEGDDFATLVQVYSDGDKRLLSFGRGTYPQEVDDQIFYLGDGEQSGPISTSEGTYYVKCINKYNEEMSVQNRSAIIEQRQKTLINDIINDQQEKYYSSVNESFFEDINIEEIRVSAASGFFSIIEAYL